MASNSTFRANKRLKDSVSLKEGVRIRGIYSTALTAILLDEGIYIANPSQVIKLRFPELPDNITPVVTIKDREDKNGIIILGFRELFEKCTKIIARMPHIILRKPGIGYYDSVKCKVVGVKSNQYIVEIPGNEKGVLITDRKHRIGDYVDAHVIAPLATPPILREGLAVVGRFARIYEGKDVSFSRFIKNYEKKALLLSASNKARERGLAVRWRSSANTAPLSVILKELDELINEICRLKKMSENFREVIKLHEGENIAEAVFTFFTKLYLDSIRSLRVPTVRFHHYIKRTGSEETQHVDFVEELHGCCSLDCIGRLLLKRIYNNLRKTKQTVLLHEKISGEVIKLKGNIKNISSENILTIVRTIKSEGIYDGLGIEKQYGDVIYTYIRPGIPFIVHEYRSASGCLKGYYINVNTPVEVLFSEEEKLNAYIWYVDLEIDIVRLKNEKARIIDDKTLFDRYMQGFMRKDLYNYAIAIANILRKQLIKYDRFEVSPKDLLKTSGLQFL